MRWLVGDVHGCALELEALLEQVRFDPTRDELWSLGDLVNRGPDSLAALRLWRDVDGRAVLGNHDLYALLARSGRRPRRRDELDALFRSEQADELLGRLRQQPALVHLEGDERVREAWIVHAGLHPLWDDLPELARKVNEAAHDDDWLESPDLTFAASVRCCTSEGQRAPQTGPPRDCQAPYRPWDAFYRGRTLVVHAHWASRGFYLGERTMGLDSGCVWGGKLTAWCQEEDRIVQIPSRGSGHGPRRLDFAAD